ncbi:MAG: tetratricopeptide repeat protein, partial [Terrimicrobiaceae bacterium]|nr:tetratricopeptide repeat protein [Terrimicrobiaceae bacterium]
MRGLVLAALLAGAACESARPEETAPAPGFIPEAAQQAAAEGNKAFERRDYPTARKAYQRALDLAPGNLVALVNLGLVEFSAGNTGQAEKLLKEAVRQRIETAPAWQTLGMIYMDQGRLDEALAALAQAAVLDPRNARTRNYLGVVIGRKGWLDGAQSELRTAVELDPAYSDAHFN